jgi:hypothetical protein
VKPKQHRLHYHRKQLKKTDPRLVCRSEHGAGPHVPRGSVNATDQGDTWELQTWCQMCGDKIVTSIKAPTENDLKKMTSWELVLNAAGEWRTWQYIIHEVPW